MWGWRAKGEYIEESEEKLGREKRRRREGGEGGRERRLEGWRERDKQPHLLNK